MDPIPNLLSPQLFDLRERLQQLNELEDKVVESRIRLLVRFHAVVQRACDEDGIEVGAPLGQRILVAYAEAVGLTNDAGTLTH